MDNVSESKFASLRDKVMAEMRHRNWNASDLATNSLVDIQQIDAMISGVNSLTEDDASDMASTLGIDMEDVDA